MILSILIFTIAKSQDWEERSLALKLKLSHTNSPKEKVDLLNEIADILRYNQLEEGLIFAKKALDLSQAISYPKGSAKSLYNIGVLYYYKGDYKASLDYYLQSKKLFDQIKDKESFANTESAIGSIYFSLGQYDKALEMYNSALRHYENTHNLVGIAQTKDNIGTLYYYQKNIQKSLQYNLESIETFKKSNNTETTFYSTALTNLGMYYFEMGDTKNAEKYFQESLSINKKIGNQYLLAKNYCSLGDIYFKLNDSPQSVKYHSVALQIGEKIGNQEVIGYANGDLGRTYLLESQQKQSQQQKKESLQKAEDYLQKATVIFQKTQNIQAYQEYLLYLSDVYSESGRYQKALDIFKKHSFFKDSLFNENKLKEFTRKELGFEFSKREDSLKMLNDKRLAVKDAMLQQNKKMIWLYLFAILLLLVIGGLLIFQNRNQKKNNRKLSKLNTDLREANEIKSRFFNILNHDLRAPISNVIKFLKLSQNKDIVLDDTTKNRLESQTVNAAESLLVTMEDLLLWSKGQMQNFELHIENINIKELFNSFIHQYRLDDNVFVKMDIPDNVFLKTDENYLKTIIRNLTSNAIKATSEKDDPIIKWTAFSVDNMIKISISDNGKGAKLSDFDALYHEEHQVSVKSGLGLHLVREMASAINCQIIIKSEIQEGTTIELVFYKNEPL